MSSLLDITFFKIIRKLLYVDSCVLKLFRLTVKKNTAFSQPLKGWHGGDTSFSQLGSFAAIMERKEEAHLLGQLTSCARFIGILMCFIWVLPCINIHSAVNAFSCEDKYQCINNF